MRTVNMREAKTHLSRLVADASAGEEILLAKAGKPVARLGPLERVTKRRKLGVLAGRFTVPDDFDASSRGCAGRLRGSALMHFLLDGKLR